MAIFWVLSWLAPRSTTTRRALLSLLIAFSIELFKLLRTPALDAFRLTLPGKLLLGRYFSVRDLLAYAVAFAVAAMLDEALFRADRASAVG